MLKNPKYSPLLSLLVMSLLMTLAGPLTAETLSVPEEGKQETFSITLPGRGMTMGQVEERFGEPATKEGPVGTPPITTWVYDRFTVYFEDRYVIHAVFHKPK